MSIVDLFRPIYYLFMNIITFLVTLLIHRDKEILLMGSWYGYRFGGNTRYLFQYLSRYKKKYHLKKVIWVTRSIEIYEELCKMGYEVYMMKSLRGIYYHFKAGVHAINVNTSTSSATSKKLSGDIMGELSLGACKLFLNHAVSPMKSSKFLMYDELGRADKIKVDVYKAVFRIYLLRHFMLVPGGWDRFIYISPTKETIKRDKKRSPYYKGKKYLEAGFPELCKPLKYTGREKEVISIIKQRGKKILYVPTYRTSEKTGYRHPLNDPAIREFLRKNNYLWIDKLHPGAKESMKADRYDADIAISLESEFDINIIIQYVDILISDYSSVVQKGIYYHKPIIYYWMDLEGYQKYSNGIPKSFYDDAVGLQAYVPQELIKQIEFVFGNDYFGKYNDLYRKKFISFFGNKKSDYKEICNKLFRALDE